MIVQVYELGHLWTEFHLSIESTERQGLSFVSIGLRELG